MTTTDSAWSEQELAALRACVQAPSSASRTRLLSLLHEVLHRSHVQRSGNRLRPSHEILRGIRLLEDQTVFPGITDLAPRLDFLARALDEASQRPVVELVAEIALDLDIAHQWSADAERRALVVTACRAAEIPVISVVVLETRLTGEGVARERLRGLHLKERLNRIRELVAFLDERPMTAEVPELVQATFAALFEGAGEANRDDLVQAVFQSLEKHDIYQRHDRWHQLVDPLVIQNRGNEPLLRRVIMSLKEHPRDVVTPYLRLYLHEVPAALLDADTVRLAGRCGTSVLQALVALKQQRTFFGPTELARAATAAADEIIAREGLDALSGGLAIADGTEGALALVGPAEGAFSVPAPPPPAPSLWERLTSW